MARPRSNRRGTVFITIIIIFAIALAVIFIFRAIYSNEQPAASDNNSSASSADDVIDPQPSSDDTEDADPVPDTTETSDTPLQYEGADPNASTTIEAVLTYYGIQNGEYLVNINISQYLSGTCQITLGDYTGSVAIDQGAANSACSFHIPTNRLQSGLQSLKVNVQSSAATGVIEETIDVSL